MGVTRALPRLAALALLSAALSACRAAIFHVPPRPSRDGYRATFVASDGARSEIAARGPLFRWESGSPPLVRIVDLRSRTATLLRPDRKLAWTGAMAPADVLAPDYDFSPGWSPQERLPATLSREDLGDDVQAGHVCALTRAWTNDTDSVVYWAAKDLDGLLVRMEWDRLVAGEFRQLRLEEMVAVRPGADPALFQAPAGFARAAAREDLTRGSR